MPGVEILAHRGWWDKPAQRNTLEALERALEAGLGVETDVRDCSGEIVVSHDPPIHGVLLFRKLLDRYVKAAEGERPGYLALNVKADGMQEAIKALLQEYEIGRYFMFDMSVPDEVQWLKAGLRTFTRQSELEREPVLYERAAGVWLDGFETDWYGREVVQRHLAGGKMVAVVSPEIHGREPGGVWEMVRDVAGERQPKGRTTKPPKGGTTNGKLFICTDRVGEARRFFHGED